MTAEGLAMLIHVDGRAFRREDGASRLSPAMTIQIPGHDNSDTLPFGGNCANP